MAAKLFNTDQLLLREVAYRRCVTVSDWRHVIASIVTAPRVVPVLRDAKELIKMGIADYAEYVQCFVFDRRNDPLDVCLGSVLHPVRRIQRRNVE